METTRKNGLVAVPAAWDSRRRSTHAVALVTAQSYCVAGKTEKNSAYVSDGQVNSEKGTKTHAGTATETPIGARYFNP